MNRIKRILSIAISVAMTPMLCLPVYANENILNLDFSNGYNFEYFYADAATVQNQSNCPWFENINDTIVYDTGSYSGNAYPTKSNGRPAYPRANIKKAVRTNKKVAINTSPSIRFALFLEVGDWFTYSAPFAFLLY